MLIALLKRWEMLQQQQKMLTALLRNKKQLQQQRQLQY